MEIKNHSVRSALKISTAIFLLAARDINAQERDSLKFRNIETVKILKINSVDKNKSKISTTSTDFLNHDAGKFLNAIPEISGIKKAGNYATDPVLRGFKYEQLNVVIDGAMNAINACPSRMDPAASQINMNIVKEAEIYKGPYNFRYGSALGGTINFVTVEPKFSDKTKFGGRISTGYESNGTILRNELLADISTKKVVWNIFGSYQKGDRYKDGNGNQVRSEFLRYNIGTKGIYNWNENNRTSLQISTNQGRNVEFAALTMDLLYDKTWMAQLKHLAKFNTGFFNQIEFNSYVSDVRHSMGTQDMKMVSDIKSNTYGARTELKKSWEHNIFYTGADYRHEDARNIRTVMPMMGAMKMRDGSSWQNSEIEQVGWFAEFQRIIGKSKITASARLDYNFSDAKEPSKLFSTVYGNLKSKNLNHSLSFGYSNRYNAYSQISVWVGRARRSGSLTERYINLFPLGNDAYEMLGNPDLKPETNNQADVIYSFQNDRIFFQADGFYSYMQDYISGIVRKDIKPYNMMSPGVRQFQNMAGAMKTGIEGRFSWEILAKLKTEMGVAYTYAEDLHSKRPLPEIYPLAFRWKLEADFSPVLLGLNYHFSGKQNRVSDEFGELKTPDFSIFNLTGKVQVSQNAYFTAEVSNIFDRAYSEHLNHAYSTDKMQRIQERGRSYSLGFSCNF